MPSPVPVRYPSGVSTDFPWGVLANFGLPNPLSYHVIADDFDSLATTDWTQTKTGAGTIALAAGDGGLALFTTAATAVDLCSIQTPAASFNFTAGKKSFFLTRLQSSDMTNAGILAGWIQTTTTPFTVVDGLYFLKASGSASNLILRSTVASVNVDLTIPTNAYALANATVIDLGIYVDRNQNVQAFVGFPMIGYVPESGTGTSTSLRGSDASSSPSLTTANLNPTVAIVAGTATVKTLTLDCVLSAKER